MNKKKSLYLTASCLALGACLYTPIIRANDPVVTYSSHQDVEETDTPLAVAGKGIQFMRENPKDFKRPGAPTYMSFDKEADLMQKALGDAKASVKASPFMNTVSDESGFDRQYSQSFKTSLKRKPLTLTGDQGEALATSLSPKMVKALKSYIRNTYQRGEFEKDNELGSFFSMTSNKLGDISVITDDLGICTPFFQNAKGGLGVDYLTPYGKSLTAKQKNAALFIHRVLGEYPRFPLKRALRVAKEYLGETDGSLWNILSGTSTIRLPVEQDLTKYTFPNMSREDKAFCLQMLINTTDWNQIYALGREVNLDDRFIPLVYSKRSLVKDTAHVGMHRLLQYAYNNTLEIKRRIEKDTWKEVYDYAEGLGISVDRVRTHHKASLADYKAYMLETNPLLDMYDQIAHIRSLIKTKYWKDVYAYTNKIPLSADHVVFLNKHKNDLSFHSYINAINPFQAGTLNK